MGPITPIAFHAARLRGTIRAMTRKLLSCMLVFVVGLLAGSGLTYHLIGRYAKPFQANERRSQALNSIATRPWAVRLDKSGLPNLHKVSDALYRGAQPTEEGYAALKAMGVKTVVCLRESRSNDDAVRQAALEPIHISSDAWDLKPDEVAAFLKVATDPARQPVFVHCRHGADRTGTMCAAYRIAVQGWTKGEALLEMTRGGFGFHSNFENLVEFLENLDVDALCRQAGLAGVAKR